MLLYQYQTQSHRSKAIYHVSGAGHSMKNMAVHKEEMLQRNEEHSDAFKEIEFSIMTYGE